MKGLSKQTVEGVKTELMSLVDLTKDEDVCELILDTFILESEGLLNAEKISDIKALSKHFGLLYLPIIWAVLACIFIYRGLKNNVSEYSKIGFALVAVTILKLYLYDVWEMDNVSRIIAFIILGIILLLSSFLFQRLKKIIKNLVENKEDKPETENL
jgi:hypothetical protein